MIRLILGIERRRSWNPASIIVLVNSLLDYLFDYHILPALFPSPSYWALSDHNSKQQHELETSRYQTQWFSVSNTAFFTHLRQAQSLFTQSTSWRRRNTLGEHLLIKCITRCPLKVKSYNWKVFFSWEQICDPFKLLQKRQKWWMLSKLPE